MQWERPFNQRHAGNIFCEIIASKSTCRQGLLVQTRCTGLNQGWPEIASFGKTISMQPAASAQVECLRWQRESEKLYCKLTLITYWWEQQTIDQLEWFLKNWINCYTIVSNKRLQYVTGCGCLCHGSELALMRIAGDMTKTPTKCLWKPLSQSHALRQKHGLCCKTQFTFRASFTTAGASCLRKVNTECK